MKSIKDEVNSEIIINKSRFITELKPLTSLENIEDILTDIKDKYKGASHYCYAYKFENIKKCSDDKEPTGTAGLPILNVLDNNDLDNIICIVVRYFGGIKLGVGGLVRAYTKAITTCLNKAYIVNIKKGFKITIVFNYENSKQIDYILKNYKIVSKNYNAFIEYQFLALNDNIIDTLKDLIIDSKSEKDIWI